MAWYPKARRRPTDRHRAGQRLAVRMDRYDAGIDHTAVAGWDSDTAFNFFNTSGRATPHVWFNKDGSVDQYIDTEFRSSAVLNGNHRCITWETWDGWPTGWVGANAPVDNPAIVAAKAEFMQWLNTEHGIPLTAMPDSKPSSRGMGWHRLGIDGNFPVGLLAGRVEGGEKWSAAFGKGCPTDLRIKQFVEVTLPLARDEDMALSDADIDKIAKRIWYTQKIKVIGTEDTISAAQMLQQVHNRTGGIKSLAGKLAVELKVSETLVEGAIRKVLGSLDT